MEDAGNPTRMDFPFADAPGIIRANQKDAWVERDLFRKLKDVIQSLKGVRFTHNWSLQIQALAALLYLGLTTLSGSRTLGEEYTDLYYVTNDRKLPTQLRLGLYVVASGLAPVVLPKYMTLLKQYLRRLSERFGYKTGEDEVSWLEEHVTPASVVSVNLAIFYFTGAYYQISKRLFGLRYVFGYRVDPMQQPTASYELIGFLMTLKALSKLLRGLKGRIPGARETVDSNEDVTEMGPTLADPEVLPFLKGRHRVCNQCYDDLRAPTVTPCGHMFCWSCISGWCRENQDCPLCRQDCEEQHLLNLRI